MLKFKAFEDNAQNNFKKWQEICILIGIGLVIGFVNGFLGAGGGILLVPILAYIIKEPIKVAHSTAVFIILPLCVASGIAYWVKDAVPWHITWKVLIGVFAGGVAGTFLLKKLSNVWITLIFALVMIGAGVKMIFF